MKKSIKLLIKEKPYIISKKPGFPNIGLREDKNEYSYSVKKIEEAWYFYDTDLYNLKTNEKIIKLGSGNPIKYKSFPCSIQNLKKHFSSNKLYQYPPAAGDENSRKRIANYLIKEGFPKYLTIDNVIVTCSTTQGFYLILKSIFRPYDCILMTAPNYGLFAFMPERLNIGVEVIELQENDGFLLDSDKLEIKIKEINKGLYNQYKEKLNYIPCVRAYLNINPHNPLGTVLSEENIELLNNIADICDKNGVFIIDDLIYRDLTYDRKEIAKPIGTLENYFDNTISLFGLSKSYGLAGVRAGFIVANDKVIRLLRDNLFYIMDSAPYLQALLLSGAYNDSLNRKICYKMYFKKVTSIYQFNCNLVTYLVEGEDYVKGLKKYKEIKNFIKKHIKNNEHYRIVAEGIPCAKIKIEPNSGFFMLIDFTNLKNYSNIKTEKELLKYLYEKCGTKFLVGQSFSWPNKNELIIRITYSLEKTDLLEGLFRINIAIRELIKNGTDRNNCNSK